MFIENCRHRFSVAKMASRLGVSVSSYYDYRQCKHIRREANKMLLSQKIRAMFDKCHQLYGSRRLTVELNLNDVRVSHTTVAKYMQHMGLRSKFYPKYRKTIDSKHSNNVAENLFGRNFKVYEPNKVWGSDITYVSTVGGFEYLTTVIDLFDRKVIEYSLSRTMRACDTVIPALKMAIKRRLNVLSARGWYIQTEGYNTLVMSLHPYWLNIKWLGVILARAIVGIMLLLRVFQDDKV